MLDLLGSCLQDILFFMLHIKGPNMFPKPLSYKEEKKYLISMKFGDQSARNKLIEHNLRLVAHVAKKYYLASNNQDDLVSIGTIGLIKAIDTFDVTKGIRLSSYAARCIENEVLMFFRNGKKSEKDVSINEPIETDKNGNSLVLIDIMSTGEDITERIDLKIKTEKLKKYINEDLSKREQTIIKLRYGLFGEKTLTQREIAKKLNISRSYVSRIEKKIVSTLRKKFKKDT